MLPHLLPTIEFKDAYGTSGLISFSVKDIKSFGHCADSVPFPTTFKELNMWTVFRYPIGQVPIEMATFSTPGAASKYMLAAAQSCTDRFSIRLQQRSSIPVAPVPEPRSKRDRKIKY